MCVCKQQGEARRGAVAAAGGGGGLGAAVSFFSPA